MRVVLRYGLILLVFALLGFVGFLFVVQNSARDTQLSLDLGVAAWQLAQPLSVPALIGLCFGAGFVLGVLTMGAQAARLGRRARRLEQQIATSGSQDRYK